MYTTFRRMTARILTLGLVLTGAALLVAAGPAPNQALDADVIVVGSGLAGHGAVYGALEAGAKVLLLEKNPQLGGTSFTATGTYSAAGTRVQKQQGITDSKELFIKDINRIGHGKADQDLLVKFVEESTAVWEWFVDSGMPVSPRGAVIDPVHSAYTVARTTMPAKNSANEYVRVLMEKAKANYEKNLTAMVNSKVTSLVVENGKVTGVRASTPEGEKTFRAKSVVLATGGYGSNREMIKKYSPRYAEYRTVTPPFATGEGIEMAKAAGARLVNMDYVVGYFGGMPKDASSYALGFGDLTSGFAEGFKGEIWVNSDGKRFVDEDELDEDVRETAIQTVSDGKMIVVFDQGIMEKNGGKTPIRTFDQRMAEGYSIKKADSLDALARAFGIDPAGLAGTVSEVNAGVASGKADAFGKKTGMAFSKGPYYGVLAYATIFMTQGGVAADTRLRAVAEDGKAIPGLYVAGEIMGTTQWGGYGYAGGTGNAPAIVFGLDAGREAARFAK